MKLCNKLSDKTFNVGDKRRMVHYQDKAVSHSICTSLCVTATDILDTLPLPTSMLRELCCTSSIPFNAFLVWWS